MLASEKNAIYGTRFRGVECKSLDKSVSYFTFCSVKAYSRTVSTLSFGIKTDNSGGVIFRLVANYRYENIYREVMDTKSIDWCAIMDGLLNEYNLFFKLVLDMVRQSLRKEDLHRCPYGGLVEVHNLTIDDEVIKKMTIFPEGQYKYNFSISNRPGNPVLIMVVYTEVKSPLKNSFG